MGYKYLASPYSDPDPLVREMRYLRTADVVRTLLKNGLHVYSPIVHCHELAKIWDMPRESEFWDKYNRAMLDSSDGLFILRLEGWSRSVGIGKERVWAVEQFKPITYISGDLNAEAAVTLNSDSTEPAAEGIR